MEKTNAQKTEVMNTCLYKSQNRIVTTKHPKASEIEVAYILYFINVIQQTWTEFKLSISGKWGKHNSDFLKSLSFTYEGLGHMLANNIVAGRLYTFGSKDRSWSSNCESK